MQTSESAAIGSLFPVIDPERIPSRRYYDQPFFDAEGQHLWPHVWQMAYRLEQIPSLCDWVEYRAGAKPERLAQATHRLGGTFDDEIKNLGSPA